MSLVLLGTAACHLCEDAQDVLMRLTACHPWDVYLEDIADSEAMVERYGMRIPVLKHEQTGEELDWPFDEQDVLNFIQRVLHMPDILTE